MKQSTLNVAIVQVDITWMNTKANLLHIQKLIMDYHELSMSTNTPVDIWVLPEMFTTGFTMDVLALNEQDTIMVVDWMKQLAKWTNSLVIGSVAVKEGDKYINRLFACTQWEVASIYDKIKTYTPSGESALYERGHLSNVFIYKGWRLKTLICYDLRFPALSSNPDVYDLLIYVASWPNPRISHWTTLLQARSIENQAYVVGVNRVGVDPLKNTYSGSSVAFDPMGQLVISTELNVEQIKIAQMSIDRLNSVRNEFPFIKDISPN